MFQELLQQNSNKVLRDIRRRKKPDKSYSDTMLKYHAYRIDGSGDRESLYTFNIKQDNIRKELVEALILSEAKPDDVEAIFGMPPTVMGMYKELFFETDNFFSRLDIISYLETYDSEFGKAVKIRAYNMGPEFLYYKYANISPRTETQKRLVKQMFMGSAYRAMEANYAGVTSAKSKASVAHANVMVKAYEAMQKLMDDNTSGRDEFFKVIAAKDKAEGLKIKSTEAKIMVPPDTKDMI